ncbi:magnesium transporter CorA family protein [Patescibacteria group bacterium]
MSMKEVKNKKNKLRWVNLVKPSNKDRQDLKAEFGFHRIDLVDAFRLTYRSKIAKREDYVFLVLMVPAYNRETRAITIHEIDLFIGKNFLVSVHQGKVAPIQKLFVSALKNTKKRADLMNRGVEHLLHQIVKDTLENTYPMIDVTNDELEELKETIFYETAKRNVLVEEILRIRRNITDMRKSLRGHGTVIEHLIKEEKERPSIKLVKSPAQFELLVHEANEIWVSLESNKEMIEALEDANDSMITHGLNSIIKTLTVFSAILLPAAVMAGIFGMNTKNTPLIGHPLDFWIIILIGFILTLGLFIVLWRKHWIE